MLELRNVSKMVGGVEHIRDVSLTLRHGSLNVLLGPTLSGKTSLMRLMAGLDVPTSGTVWFDGKNVTGVPVQKRNIAMVYQQFINYPAMTVYENIASPLRVAGADAARIDREVKRAAELLKLTPYLAAHAAQPVRRPAAAHRARPGDRQECRPRAARRAARQSRLQAARGTARRAAEASSPKAARSSSTRRPSRTRRCCSAAIRRRCRKAASRSSGRPSRFSASRTTSSRRKTFSDPPLNTIVLRKKGASFLLDGGVNLPVPAELAGIADSSYTIGFQPHHLSLTRPNATGRLGRCQGLGHRDHRLGELRPSRFRRRALGDAGARHTRLRAGRDDRGLHRSASHHGVRRERPLGGGAATGWRHRGGRWRASTSTTSATPTRPIRSRTPDYALKEVHHTFDDGGAYALLGPSGCGKTTLLNIISGLLHAVARQAAVRRPRRHRAVDAGAQHRAGVPVPGHLRHHDGLRQSGVSAAQSRRAGGRRRPQGARDRSTMIDLADWPARRARGLTADQKQKISLGRGLVRSDVNAILFDEPLTVIDPHMKWVLRSQLKQLHRRFGYTMVYVTHDQTEALTFADQVVVMYEGEIVQIGTPADLFERPKHTFVGYFIGSPGMNVMPVAVEGGTARLGAQTIELPGRAGGRVRRQHRARHPARICQARPRTACRSTIRQGRGHRPPQDRARQASRAARSRSSCGEDEEVPADPKVALRPARHQPLRRLLARRDGSADAWTRPGTTRPGSWCCRCCCWSPSTPSSR